MRSVARVLTWLGLSGCILSGPLAAGDMSGIVRTERTLQKDRRAVVDRLDAPKNPSRRDDSFLNAVGAVWAYGINKSGAGYAASTGDRAATGFLIDRCHVLTNMHVVYDDPVVVNPPLAHPVAFAVGQTESERDRGALQGLKFLLPGTVIAHGDTLIIDGVVHNPADDWAVIRLATNADGTIVPMTIEAVDEAQLPKHLALSSAGYPSDHRMRRGDGFKLKDLWRSEGEVVGVTSVSSMAALIQTTIQTTPGNSGGPIFGDFNGHQHIVIGIVQSIRGNGIDVSESEPNVELMFTASTIARITEAREGNPCSQGLLVQSKQQPAGQADRPLPTPGNAGPTGFQIPTCTGVAPEHEVEDHFNAMGRPLVPRECSGHRRTQTDHEFGGRRQLEGLFEDQITREFSATGSAERRYPDARQTRREVLTQDRERRSPAFQLPSWKAEAAR